MARAKCPVPESVRFFANHAGFARRKGEGWKKARLRAAKRLARAECRGEQRGINIHWEHDRDPDLSWMSADERAEVRDVFCARAELNGETLDSVCGIVDPDRNYQRVIAAELMLEATSRRRR